MWIKNMSALMSKFRSHDHKAHWCFSCLRGFNKQERLDKHIERGCDVNAVLEVPEQTDAFVWNSSETT